MNYVNDKINKLHYKSTVKRAAELVSLVEWGAGRAGFGVYFTRNMSYTHFCQFNFHFVVEIDVVAAASAF